MSGGMCHICCSCRFTLWENITSKRRVRKGPLKVWLPRREQKFRDDLFITREKEESRSLLKKQPLIEVLKHTEIKKGDFDLCLSICFLDIYKIVLQPFKTTQKYKIAKIKKKKNPNRNDSSNNKTPSEIRYMNKTEWFLLIDRWTYTWLTCRKENLMRLYCWFLPIYRSILVKLEAVLCRGM